MRTIGWSPDSAKTTLGPRGLGGGAQAMTHFTDARGNLFGHSAPDVLGRLAQSGATILRTDRPGHIQI